MTYQKPYCEQQVLSPLFLHVALKSLPQRPLVVSLTPEDGGEQDPKPDWQPVPQYDRLEPLCNGAVSSAVSFIASNVPGDLTRIHNKSSSFRTQSSSMCNQWCHRRFGPAKHCL